MSKFKELVESLLLEDEFSDNIQALYAKLSPTARNICNKIEDIFNHIIEDVKIQNPKNIQSYINTLRDLIKLANKCNIPEEIINGMQNYYDIDVNNFDLDSFYKEYFQDYKWYTIKYYYKVPQPEERERRGDFLRHVEVNILDCLKRGYITPTYRKQIELNLPCKDLYNKLTSDDLSQDEKNKLSINITKTIAKQLQLSGNYYDIIGYENSNFEKPKEICKIFSKGHFTTNKNNDD